VGWGVLPTPFRTNRAGSIPLASGWSNLTSISGWWWFSDHPTSSRCSKCTPFPGLSTPPLHGGWWAMCCCWGGFKAPRCWYRVQLGSTAQGLLVVVVVASTLSQPLVARRPLRNWFAMQAACLPGQGGGGSPSLAAERKRNLRVWTISFPFSVQFSRDGRDYSLLRSTAAVSAR
jgi:hypothetical protein